MTGVLEATSSWAFAPLGLFPLLAELAIKASVVLLVAAAVALAMRRRSAAERHFVWAAAFAVLALLPALAVAAPDWRVVPNPAVAGPPASVRVVTQLRPGADVRAALRSRAPQIPPSAAGSGTQVRTIPRWTFTAGLGAIWLVGMLAIAIPYAVGTLGVRRWTRRGRVLNDAGWSECVETARGITGTSSAPVLVENEWTSVPLVWGWKRPIVFLPAGSREWTSELRTMVLTHELAHVRRRDVAIEALVQLACGIFWFHPLVWLAARRLRLERERACDDVVVRSGTRASVYGRHLLAIADDALRQSPPPIVAMCMARGRDFQGRMATLLTVEPARGGTGRRLRYAVLGAAVLAAASLGPAAFSRQMLRSSVPDGASLVFMRLTGDTVPRIEFIGTDAEARRFLDSVTGHFPSASPPSH